VSPYFLSVMLGGGGGGGGGGGENPNVILIRNVAFKSASYPGANKVLKIATLQFFIRALAHLRH
jgi:hypothetical protein